MFISDLIEKTWISLIASMHRRERVDVKEKFSIICIFFLTVALEDTTIYSYYVFSFSFFILSLHFNRIEAHILLHHTLSSNAARAHAYSTYESIIGWP